MKRTFDLIRANAREFDLINGEGAALREAIGFFVMMAIVGALTLGLLILLGE